MLVLRSLSWQTTLNWTNRTLLPDNCPKERLQTTISPQTSSSNNLSRILSRNTFITTASSIGNQRPQHHHPAVNAQFLNTVIQKLPFLMNEIRTKKNFSSILNNCSPFTNNNHHHHRHRCHQASKSNKVFLRYTPRDPRLRFNKHSSELSEDLCNYGELIGGTSNCSFNSLPSSISRSSNNSSRYVETILAKNSSFSECTKKNNTQLLTSNIY